MTCRVFSIAAVLMFELEAVSATLPRNPDIRKDNTVFYSNGTCAELYVGEGMGSVW